MYLRFGDNFAAILRSFLLEETAVGASHESVTAPEGAPVPAMMLRSDTVDWIIANHKLKCVASFEARWLTFIFPDVRKATIYDYCSLKCITDICRWNSLRNLRQSWCTEHLDSICLLDMPDVRHEHECNYVFRLIALTNDARKVKRLMEPDACCRYRPHFQYYLIPDANFWSEIELSVATSTETGPLPVLVSQRRSDCRTSTRLRVLLCIYAIGVWFLQTYLCFRCAAAPSICLFQWAIRLAPRLKRVSFVVLVKWKCPN